jgi:hypothetical protein
MEDTVADRQHPAEDAMMTRIGQVIMLHRGGDREEARGRFLGLWSEIGEDGDPLHRCTLAHFMADTQDDPVDELVWDLRALSAADESTAGPPAGQVPAGPPVLLAFYPALHLSLAADYEKLGRTEAARSHIHHARRAARALGDDGYSTGIRAAIGRLERRLAGSDAGGFRWDDPPGAPHRKGWGGAG